MTRNRHKIEEKTFSFVCEQQKYGPDCAVTQSDPNLCYSIATVSWNSMGYIQQCLESHWVTFKVSNFCLVSEAEQVRLSPARSQTLNSSQFIISMDSSYGWNRVDPDQLADLDKKMFSNRILYHGLDFFLWSCDWIYNYITLTNFSTN